MKLRPLFSFVNVIDTDGGARLKLGMKAALVRVQNARMVSSFILMVLNDHRDSYLNLDSFVHGGTGGFLEMGIFISRGFQGSSMT